MSPVQDLDPEPPKNKHLCAIAQKNTKKDPRSAVYDPDRTRGGIRGTHCWGDFVVQIKVQKIEGILYLEGRGPCPLWRRRGGGGRQDTKLKKENLPDVPPHPMEPRTANLACPDGEGILGKMSTMYGRSPRYPLPPSNWCLEASIADRILSMTVFRIVNRFS